MKNPTREEVEQQLEHILLSITHNVVSVPLREYQNIRRAYLRALNVIEWARRAIPEWAGEDEICPETEKCPDCDAIRVLARFDEGDDEEHRREEEEARRQQALYAEHEGE